MDEELYQAVLTQAFEFWINPEIERRQTAGELPDDFVLVGAQVIFDIDVEAPQVRLNGEVEAVAVVGAARTIDKGQEVTEADIAGYKEILLTDRDPNAGHITIVAHQGQWMLAFDFRRNAARIAEHIELARQFIQAAAWAREQSYSRVFVDNLFSATELMAKGFLIWMPDKTLLDARSHGPVHARFNYQRKMNNVDERFAALLNRLAALRRPARYLAGEFTLADDEMDEMLAVAEEMHQTLEASSPKRASVT